MAGSPRFKIHNSAGEYIASCKHLEDAANLVGANGDGCKIKDAMTGTIVWREGAESFSAADSWDGVAQLGWQRIRAKVDAAEAKRVAIHAAYAANRKG